MKLNSQQQCVPAKRIWKIHKLKNLQKSFQNSARRLRDNRNAAILPFYIEVEAAGKEALGKIQFLVGSLT